MPVFAAEALDISPALVGGVGLALASVVAGVERGVALYQRLNPSRKGGQEYVTRAEHDRDHAQNRKSIHELRDALQSVVLSNARMAERIETDIRATQGHGVKVDKLMEAVARLEERGRHERHTGREKDSGG
jgi:hypothetical protein